MKTSEVLNTAADKIEQYGWVQGDEGWDNHEGAGLCLEGGILAAMNMSHGDRVGFESCPAYVAVRDYLSDDFSSSVCFLGLWAFNDRTDVNKEKVIGVLRATAVVEAAKKDAEQSILVGS